MWCGVVGVVGVVVGGGGQWWIEAVKIGKQEAAERAVKGCKKADRDFGQRVATLVVAVSQSDSGASFKRAWHIPYQHRRAEVKRAASERPGVRLKRVDWRWEINGIEDGLTDGGQTERRRAACSEAG